jgi:hypothetical protein
VVPNVSAGAKSAGVLHASNVRFDAEESEDCYKQIPSICVSWHACRRTRPGSTFRSGSARSRDTDESNERSSSR